MDAPQHGSQLDGAAAPADLVALELAHDHVGRRGEVGGRPGQVAQLREDVAEGLEAEVLLVVDGVPQIDVPRELACASGRGGRSGSALKTVGWSSASRVAHILCPQSSARAGDPAHLRGRRLDNAALLAQRKSEVQGQAAR